MLFALDYFHLLTFSNQSLNVIIFLHPSLSPVHCHFAFCALVQHCICGTAYTIPHHIIHGATTSSSSSSSFLFPSFLPFSISSMIVDHGSWIFMVLVTNLNRREVKYAWDGPTGVIQLRLLFLFFLCVCVCIADDCPMDGALS